MVGIRNQFRRKATVNIKSYPPPSGEPRSATGQKKAGSGKVFRESTISDPAKK
jgi:hypothetical protein